MQAKEVIDLAGGVRVVSTAFKCSRHSVYGWIYRNAIPAYRVLELSKMSNLTPEQICPAVFAQQKTPHA